MMSPMWKVGTTTDEERVHHPVHYAELRGVVGLQRFFSVVASNLTKQTAVTLHWWHLGEIAYKTDKSQQGTISQFVVNLIWSFVWRRDCDETECFSELSSLTSWLVAD